MSDFIGPDDTTSGEPDALERRRSDVASEAEENAGSPTTDAPRKFDVPIIGAPGKTPTKGREPRSRGRAARIFWLLLGILATTMTVPALLYLVAIGLVILTCGSGS